MQATSDRRDEYFMWEHARWEGGEYVKIIKERIRGFVGQMVGTQVVKIRIGQRMYSGQTKWKTQSNKRGKHMQGHSKDFSFMHTGRLVEGYKK